MPKCNLYLHLTLTSSVYVCLSVYLSLLSFWTVEEQFGNYEHESSLAWKEEENREKTTKNNYSRLYSLLPLWSTG